MYSLKELSKKYKVPYMTVYRWVKEKRLPAQQNVDRFRVNDWYVLESDWLNVPTYIRNRYQLKKSK